MQDAAEAEQTMRSCVPAMTIQLLLVHSLGSQTELVFRDAFVIWSGFPSLVSPFAFPCFFLHPGPGGGLADTLLPGVIPVHLYTPLLQAVTEPPEISTTQNGVGEPGGLWEDEEG